MAVPERDALQTVLFYISKPFSDAPNQAAVATASVQPLESSLNAILGTLISIETTMKQIVLIRITALVIPSESTAVHLPYTSRTAIVHANG